MKAPLKADRSTVVVGVSAALVLLALAFAMLYFWSLRQDFVRQIAGIEPRTARLLGIQESAAELAAANAAARGSLRDIAYPAGRDSASVAATLQQEVREVLAGAGMSVTGSQILATRRDEGYDRLALSVMAEGNIDAFDAALRALELMRPLVFVESLRAQPTRSRRGRNAAPLPPEEDPRRLNVRLQLFALRLQQ